MIDWDSYRKGLEDAAEVCLRTHREGVATLDGAIFSSAIWAWLQQRAIMPAANVRHFHFDLSGATAPRPNAPTQVMKVKSLPQGEEVDEGGGMRTLR